MVLMSTHWWKCVFVKSKKLICFATWWDSSKKFSQWKLLILGDFFEIKTVEIIFGNFPILRTTIKDIGPHACSRESYIHVQYFEKVKLLMKIFFKRGLRKCLTTLKLGKIPYHLHLPLLTGKVLQKPLIAESWFTLSLDDKSSLPTAKLINEIIVCNRK